MFHCDSQDLFHYQATVTYFLKKTTPAMTEVTQTCFTVTHGYQATVTYFLKKTTPAMTEVTQTCFTVTHRYQATVTLSKKQQHQQ